MSATLSLQSPPPPWLIAGREKLTRAVEQQRLPQAVLLRVGAGQGGEWLARWLAARMYCPTVCGQCLNCQRVEAAEHPDMQLLMPEESTEIRIEQVRQLSAQFSLTRHGKGRKVAIITPADRLNRNAANALLKTLEEPSGDALIILVTAKPSRLPATIASRCMRLTIAPPSNDAMVEWLRATAGDDAHAVDWSAVLEIIGAAPLTALTLDHTRILAIRDAARAAVREAQAGQLNPTGTAERWGKDDFVWYLTALERAAGEALRASSLQGDAHSARYWLGLLDELAEARRWDETPINKSLVIQRLLWRLSAAKTSPGRA